MNGFFNEFQPRSQRSSVRPPVDVIENNDRYQFYFDMSGLKNDSVDVRVDDGVLTVSAERKRPEWPKEASVHYSERHYGTIRRTFELPKDASQEHIHASYQDGVLEVTVEKRPESKPVKIQIN
jgi:HSP20 family protein